MKLKNMILLSGGAIASATIPVAAVLSCGDAPIATQTEVNAEQARINGLVTNDTTSLTAIVATDTTQITNDNQVSVKTRLGLPSDTNFDFANFNYFYTNKPLASSGNLMFTISVQNKNAMAATDPMPQQNSTLVTGITTYLTFFDEQPITSIISDGHDGYFIGGDSNGSSAQFNHIGANGKLISEQMLLGGSSINTMIADGKDGYFVGGDDGKLDHIGPDGKLVANWTTQTLLVHADDGGGSKKGHFITSIVSDGKDGYFVGGGNGLLDHIGPDGKLVTNWTTKQLYGEASINTMVPDGKGGVFVGRDIGYFDHIGPDGEFATNLRTQVLLGGNAINAMVSDGQGGVFVGGASGKLDHIGQDGNLVTNWTTGTLLGGNAIFAMVSDGQTGFFVGGASGKLDHIGSNGQPVANSTTKTLLGGKYINTIIANGQGGYFACGDEGRLELFTNK